MTELTDSAKKIMDRLKELNYQEGDYLAASQLIYIFDDKDEKRRALDELTSNGLIVIAPNGGVGITKAGEDWNENAKSPSEPS
jgi:hypothetical protein